MSDVPRHWNGVHITVDRADANTFWVRFTWGLAAAIQPGEEPREVKESHAHVKVGTMGGEKALEFQGYELPAINRAQFEEKAIELVREEIAKQQ